mmetsp:Transcript_18073/g.33927  ORF Transcript_18073/g.33927 Transcript_18073/m.33927 type:complete len:209 (-) Transcript_18073:369-995(-)
MRKLCEPPPKRSRYIRSRLSRPVTTALHRPVEWPSLLRLALHFSRTPQRPSSRRLLPFRMEQRSPVTSSAIVSWWSSSRRAGTLAKCPFGLASRSPCATLLQRTGFLGGRQQIRGGFLHSALVSVSAWMMNTALSRMKRRWQPMVLTRSWRRPSQRMTWRLGTSMGTGGANSATSRPRYRWRPLRLKRTLVTCDDAHQRIQKSFNSHA